MSLKISWVFYWQKSNNIRAIPTTSVSWPLNVFIYIYIYIYIYGGMYLPAYKDGTARAFRNVGI
jgi:hypothetical protein